MSITTEPSDYFAHRMAQLGVSKENNRVTLYDPAENKQVDLPIFERSPAGDIYINYWTIEGHRITYTVGTSKMPHYWRQTRLKNPTDKAKYIMPKAQGHFPFIPQELLKQYEAGEKVETLYLTEGAFKAYYAARLGVPVMGLPSITCYKENGNPDKPKIYDAVRKFVERCQVQNVVILHDADCLDVSMKAVMQGLELTKRPRIFLGQAEAMRVLIREMQFEKTRQPPSVYYMHPKRGEVEGDPKGLDDLLVAAGKITPELQQKVILDLMDPERKGKFFFRMEITSTTIHLAGHFALKKKKALEFYTLHAEKLKHRQFLFYGDLYVYINATDGLELIAPEWAEGVLWVGNDFYWKKYVPSAREGMSRYKLLPRKKEIISSVLKIKNFTDYLPYYTDFVNKPSHDNYKAIIEHEGSKYYNRYFPFEHTPKPGTCDAIMGFIKHIFGETMVIHPETKRAVPRFEMGLDYIQLLYQQPVLHLPVLCLYSQENNTGKSTFCKLLNQIFRNNAIFVSNSDLQSDFNGVFADKLLIMCEETSLDRKRDAERIKNLSTADEITVNEKNVTQFTIDFFGKFIFCSNYERMIYLTSHDERFWILKVPRAEKDNPLLMEEMVEEIPAFLEFLSGRKLNTEKKEGRMWFNAEMLKTETFYQSVEVNEPGEVSNIRHGMRDLFDVATDSGTNPDVIEMPMKCIKEEFFSPKSSDKWIAEVLRNHLGVVQRRDEHGKTRSVRGSYLKTQSQYDGENGYDDIVITKKWAGRPYVFHRTTFFPEESED